MSTKTIDSAFEFAPAKAPKTQQDGAWATLITGLKAIREGIVLASEYKALTDRGVASDVAARKVFERIGRD